MKKLTLLTLIALVAGLPASAGLVIVPTFDSSITSQGANGVLIQNAINTAIQFFENTYSNNITVKIEFQSSSSGLGSSQTGFAYNNNYQTFYNDLVATNANPAAIAGLTANGGNSANNPVNGTTIIFVKSANGRAVGIGGDAPLCNVQGSPGSLTCSNTPGGPNAIDGIISLNTSITFPPQAKSNSTFDLVATTEHEIDEILGLGSSLPNCNSGTGCTNTSFTGGNPAPQDLYRYTAPGVFAGGAINCSSITPAYLSYSGATVLTNLNTACNGGDFGDFAGGTQVQNAFATSNTFVPYGSNEIAAMTAIGYTLAAPEPATWALLISALGFAAIARRRS